MVHRLQPALLEGNRTIEEPRGYRSRSSLRCSGTYEQRAARSRLVLVWVHAVEMLYQLMGPGCESVSMQVSGNQDVVVGKWTDGRLGVMRGFSSGLYAYSITVYGEKGVLHSGQEPEGYGGLLKEIAKFVQTGVAPIDTNESLETLAFMEAADLSKARGGVAVSLVEIMK